MVPDFHLKQRERLGESCYLLMENLLENIKPIFGKVVNAEWEKTPCNLPFLLHVHALDDAKHLRLHLTDFHRHTWESIKSIQQLQHLREEAGVDGSWSDFINYMMESINSDSVKLVLDGSLLSSASGAKCAKLVAHKTKGMPLITIYLDRLMNKCATDAMTNLSWEIFKAFNFARELLVKEQQCSYELTEKLCALEEKNESIQSQLSLVLASKNQKLSKLVESNKRSPIVTPLIGLDTTAASDVNSFTGKPTTEVFPSTKISSLVPTYRSYYCRTKARRIVSSDPQDDEV